MLLNLCRNAVQALDGDQNPAVVRRLSVTARREGGTRPPRGSSAGPPGPRPVDRLRHGGERPGLARALVRKPSVFLLDEPISHLDTRQRYRMRRFIKSLHQEFNYTMIYVTHDQEEALSMSDRIVVMNEGRAAQVGTPFEVYTWPKNRFVASFVGTLNLLDGIVLDEGRLTLDGREVTVGRGLAGRRAGETVTVALRPEAVTLGATATGLPGTVEAVSFLGAVVRVKVRLDTQVVTLDAFNQTTQRPPEPGTAVRLVFGAEDLLVLGEG